MMKPSEMLSIASTSSERASSAECSRRVHGRRAAGAQDLTLQQEEQHDAGRRTAAKRAELVVDVLVALARVVEVVLS